MDMSTAYISGAKKYLPTASVTFDKFHVIKQLNEAIDTVRRNETCAKPLFKRFTIYLVKEPKQSYSSSTK